MIIFVKKPQGNTITLNVESNERICSIKRKFKKMEGIRNDLSLGLIYNGKFLEDGHTLAHYNILKESTLHYILSQGARVQIWFLFVETWSKESFTLEVKSVDTIDDVKAKIQAKKGIPPHKQLLFFLGKLLEDGSRTLVHYDIDNDDTLNLAIKFEQEIAQNKEKELEATISELKAENKKNEETAQNKEKELKAAISGLKAGNKKTEEELTIACNKEKELEATISGLRHKNKVFSDQCASYESQFDDLEVENKKTKEELMNADKKYYAGARAAGYAEGLKKGMANQLEFLHHLADTSIQFFNHGFDSCQKQAEEQGFCGQLNKACALKDAPEIKGLGV